MNIAHTVNGIGLDWSRAGELTDGCERPPADARLSGRGPVDPSRGPFLRPLSCQLSDEAPLPSHRVLPAVTGRLAALGKNKLAV
ncbi:hypothetical protein DPEC_G00175960 [Dallia pectoralis]|uniref:Uncharacterized protein n=1 Tax=Dallia pectoralis TaxID=75939 RepID=A0ACC2GE83_DALPE|nr:hypothetical protein DPEC_G00175960 [Dallia pectoralis]